MNPKDLSYIATASIPYGGGAAAEVIQEICQQDGFQ